MYFKKAYVCTRFYRTFPYRNAVVRSQVISLNPADEHILKEYSTIKFINKLNGIMLTWVVFTANLMTHSKHKLQTVQTVQPLFLTKIIIPDVREQLGSSLSALPTRVTQTRDAHERSPKMLVKYCTYVRINNGPKQRYQIICRPGVRRSKGNIRLLAPLSKRMISTMNRKILGFLEFCAVQVNTNIIYYICS